MKILVATAYDAANLSIENIVKEFIRKGHRPEIYAQVTDKKNMRMFYDLDIPIYHENELTTERIASYDIAFCTTDAMRRLRWADIYVFTYNFIQDKGVSEGADFMFTLLKNRHLLQNEDCATMPIGNAKNDIPQIYKKPQKKFLFIDSGHHPFGKKGKYQIASSILDICDKFPDYELIIKPRWLLNDIENQTHTQTLHLYQILKEITNEQLPSNLVLLNEYRNLQELIDECICTITTSYSCYLDVALRGRGCIVIDGIDEEEQSQTRNRLKEVYLYAKKAGCCVDYREITNYLPKGIRCDLNYIKEQVPYLDGVSARIVQVMEYVFEHFISVRKFPGIKQYEYETFRKMMQTDQILTFEELKYKRLKNSMLYYTRGWNLKFKAEIDFNEYYNLLDQHYHSYQLNEDGYNALRAKMGEVASDIVFKNKEKCMADAIDQAIFFQIMYNTKRNEEILKIPQENILCKGPYYYYCGMILRDQRRDRYALEYFLKFLTETNQRSYEKYPQDGSWGIRDAYNFVFGVYNGNNIEPETFASLYIDLYKRQKQHSNLVSYSLRKKAHNFLPKVAVQLMKSNQNLALAILSLYAEKEYYFNIRELRQQIENEKQSLSCQIGYAVTYLPRKIRKLGRIIITKGLISTVHQWKKEFQSYFRNHFFHIFKIMDVFNNKVIKGFELYQEYLLRYGVQTEVLLPAHAIGDTYLFGQYANTYMKKYYKDRELVFCVYGDSAMDIAKIFHIRQSEPLSMDKFYWMYNLLMFAGANCVHAKCMHYHIIYYHIGILAHLDGQHGFNIGNLTQEFLDMQDEDKETAVFYYDADFLKALFTEKKLIPGRTVLIAPYAKSCLPLPLHFWEKLANKLIVLGYCVCTNVVYDKEPPIDNTVSICIPFLNAVPFLEMAGACIGLRSGFLDVISTADCIKIALYPSNNWKHGAFSDCNEVYRMTDIYHQTNQYDLIYSQDIEDRLIEELVGMVSDYMENKYKLL